MNILSTKPYRGTRDFYPEEMRIRNWFYKIIKDVLEKYTYEEYNGPMLESFEIYAAKSGEEIVGEQTYNFVDKSNRRLAIRPEMTPTVARMVAAKLEQLALPLRWFSIANLLRYETPQRGRVREHWQVNVDMFGVSNIKAEFELISIAIDLMKAFEADDSMFKVKISSRKFFNEVLTYVINVAKEDVQAVSKVIDKRNKISKENYKKWLSELGLNEEQIDTLDKIFDCDFEELANKIEGETEGKEELKRLFEMISEQGIAEYCKFDFSVIRGFDYYTGTVFEVYDTSPENMRALFGGGRYDNLMGLFKKGSNISGIGFGFGDVTLKDFLKTHNLIPADLQENKSVLITTFENVPYNYYLNLSRELRANDISNIIFMGDSLRLKKQMVFAERKNISVILIVGEDELKTETIIVKNLEKHTEYRLDRNDCIQKLKEIINT